MGPVLDNIQSPADLKQLQPSQLPVLAAEIREFLVRTVSENGGHLASSLGVVELTIALHRVFESPDDRIIWDVGHQCYAHKLLTGRKEHFNTLRQYGGISGFTVRTESVHDPFGAGHAGTSVSAALGMALARDLRHEPHHVIAVIGDGSICSGMALEAINHAGHLGTKLIVILNDNGMSISPSVGAVSRILNQVWFHPRFETAKGKARKTITRLPLGEFAWDLSRRLKSRVESVVLPNVFWEQLGFRYLGPVDGHNITELEAALSHARDFGQGPTLIHVLTKKGKGHAAAEADASKYHGVSPHSVQAATAPSYSRVFGDTVGDLMRRDDRIVAISAAMLDGTGLSPVAEEFPDRVFDVGICEQHAVTMAAGLAARGFVPIVAVYSTFLQRAYDQIIHDVCLQKLPVVFAVDRAGIVGDDGKTHQGEFDISFLRSIPDIIVAAPRDGEEFRHLVYSAVTGGKTMAVRYPRGTVPGRPLSCDFMQLETGRAELLREGDDLALLALGSTVGPTLAAADALAGEGIECSVVNARFAKPLDEALILQLASKTGRLVTIEENVVSGGFGSAVLELLAEHDTGECRVHCLGLPDRFIEHGPPDLLRSLLELDTAGIVRNVKTVFPELLAGIPSQQENRRL